MSFAIGTECIRVKLKSASTDGNQSYHQFSIQKATTYNDLIDLICRRFNFIGDFNLSYLVNDKYGEQIMLPLQSDLDFNAALFAAQDSTLRLFAEVKPKSDEDWDIVGNGEISVQPLEDLRRKSLTMASSPPNVGLASSLRSLAGGSLLQSISQQVEKTVTSIEKVIGMRSSPLSQRGPITDAEFRRYMDSLGRIVQPNDFFRSVYLGGVEHSLRKVAWRILLNIYPTEMTGRERIALLSSKTAKYQCMREDWKRAYREGRLSRIQLEALALASVDVIRTDRNQDFYANDPKNKKIAELFDILATYAIYHPSIGYYQGMSNLASPLLYVQGNDGAAYVCFCALMQRLGCKFVPKDKLLMIIQMQHLHDLLVFVDYELAQCLRVSNLGNMFFTERWLLLELVREFAFKDALFVSEVQWAALNFTSMSYSRASEATSNSTSDGYLVLSEDAASVLFAEAPAECMPLHYPRSDVKSINSLVGEEFACVLPDTARQIPKCDSLNGDLTPPPRYSASGNRSHSGSDPIHMKDWVVELPPPDQMGGGNPFLLFLCVSLLLEYRDQILGEVREASDLFNIFQRMTKKHNHVSIVNRAQELFDAYIRNQEMRQRQLAEITQFNL